jgi:hypothetical protein
LLLISDESILTFTGSAIMVAQSKGELLTPLANRRLLRKTCLGQTHQSILPPSLRQKEFYNIAGMSCTLMVASLPNKLERFVLA